MAAINPVSIIPNEQSSGQDWLNWYKILKSRYGRKNANTVFSLAWNKRGTYSANTKELRNFMEKNGVSIEGNNPAIIIEDFVGDVTDFATSTFSTGKTVVLVGLGVAAVAVLGIVYSLVKNPENTKQIIEIASTRGMSKLK